jgi:hypothetical protein
MSEDLVLANRAGKLVHGSPLDQSTSSDVDPQCGLELPQNEKRQPPQPGSVADR